MTALALEIFDAVSDLFRLSARDRGLLEAAARLHDVGYGPSPRAHIQDGAALVTRTRLPGFKKAEVAIIAGVVLLHAKAYEKNLDNRLFQGVLRPSTVRNRTFRLGAILRVADGLDHGHVQDAGIRSIAVDSGVVRLHVESPAWPGNIAWASQKADLWRMVFPVPLQISARTVRKGRLFASVVHPDTPVLETGRRLLFVLFRQIGEEWDAALREDNPRHCHDLRVAIRRFRTVLRILRGPLERTAAARLRRDLGAFADLLGPPRDADVWLRTIAEIAPSPSGTGFAMVTRRAREERASGLAAMRSALRAADDAGLRRRIATFLRISMHEVAATGVIRRRGRSPVEWAAGRLSDAVRRAAKRGRWAEEPSAERLHDYRRIVRRGRYVAEFLAPILGGPADELAVRFKAMADALGDHHDASVGLERLAALRAEDVGGGARALRVLDRGLKKMIARSWRDFLRERKALARFDSGELRRNKRKSGRT